MILGIFLIKKDLIFHFRDNNKAPVNIKNKSTPILKQLPKNCEKNHLNDGSAPYSGRT